MTLDTSTGTYQRTDAILPLIRQLFEALDAREVSCCHWKSNWKLDNWLRGDGDLDLLVARADAPRLISVLTQLGFRQATAPADRQVPGITSYYGYDVTTNRFVHVHTHYQLILGHDLTKNYRVPIERQFLESVTRLSSIPVPAPEFELIIFVIRMVLKFSVFDSLLRGMVSAPSSVRQELDYLQARCSNESVYEVLTRHLPFLGVDFFNHCIQPLREGCDVWTRFRIRLELQRRLDAHSRQSLWADGTRKMTQRFSRVIRRSILRQSARKRLAAGGAVIAFVGGDGAGKSTSVNETYRWLSKKFDTRRVHLGKPPRSPLTLGVIVLLRVSKALHGRAQGTVACCSPNDSGSPEFPGYLQLLRWACGARDRYRLYQKARRFATGGGLVICDRYPVPQIQLMEAPHIARALRGCGTNALTRFLLQMEERWYQQMLPPDLLIVLRVPPDTAVRRKTDESAVHVRARSEELWQVDWQGTRAYVINADRPLDDVLSEVRAVVWSHV